MATLKPEKIVDVIRALAIIYASLPQILAKQHKDNKPEQNCFSKIPISSDVSGLANPTVRNLIWLIQKSENLRLLGVSKAKQTKIEQRGREIWQKTRGIVAWLWLHLTLDYSCNSQRGEKEGRKGNTSKPVTRQTCQAEDDGDNIRPKGRKPLRYSSMASKNTASTIGVKLMVNQYYGVIRGRGINPTRWNKFHQLKSNFRNILEQRYSDVAGKNHTNPLQQVKNKEIWRTAKTKQKQRNFPRHVRRTIYSYTLMNKLYLNKTGSLIENPSL